MANAIARDAELTALRDEVRQLRRLVTEMDSDMAELEWHVEQIDDEGATVRYALGGVFLRVFKVQESTDEWVRYVWGQLYPDSIGGRGSQPSTRCWQIPRRRWRQYGTREELVSAAVEQRIAVHRRMGREWIVRALARAGVRPALRSALGR